MVSVHSLRFLDRPINNKLSYLKIIWNMLLLGRFTQIMEVFVSYLILHNLFPAF